MRDKRILGRLSKRWSSAVDDLYQTVLNLGKLDRASLVVLARRLSAQRVHIFLCMIMFGLAYTLVQVNVQYNQFFVFIPFLWIVALLNRRLFGIALAMSLPWLLQLFTYGGLGRDLCCPPFVFSYFGLNKLFTGSTLVIAAINVILWVQFCRGYFNGWWCGGDSQCGVAAGDPQTSIV